MKTERERKIYIYIQARECVCGREGEVEGMTRDAVVDLRRLVRGMYFDIKTSTTTYTLSRTSFSYRIILYRRLRSARFLSLFRLWHWYGGRDKKPKNEKKRKFLLQQGASSDELLWKEADRSIFFPWHFFPAQSSWCWCCWLVIAEMTQWWPMSASRTSCECSFVATVAMWSIPFFERDEMLCHSQFTNQTVRSSDCLRIDWGSITSRSRFFLGRGGDHEAHTIFSTHWKHFV